MSKRNGKLIAAGLVIFGSLFNMYGKIFGPDRILWDEGQFFGSTAEILGWILLFFAPIIYVIVDLDELFPKKEPKTENGSENTTE